MTNQVLHLTLLFLLATFVAEACADRVCLIPFENEGRWGYKDSRGKVVVRPRFVIAQDFTPEGIAPVVDHAGWAYINAKGRVLIRPLVVDNGPDHFREGLARFAVDGKFGFFNKFGRVTIRSRFDFAAPFSEGLAAICGECKEEIAGEHRFFKGGKWGFINRKGEIVIPLRFEAAQGFQDGKARVKFDGQWRNIDNKGKLMDDRPIGSATMEEDGTMVLRLRAEGPGGLLGDTLLRYPPGHPQYRGILRHLGGLKKGESKPVPPWREE